MTTTFATPLLEQTTAVYRFTLVDEADANIDSAAINTLTLTYYDVQTQTVINSRNHQDVSNENDVTLETVNGVTTVEWLIQPADTVLVNPTFATELHEAYFQWTWDAGRRAGAHVIQFLVQNLVLTPAP